MRGSGRTGATGAARSPSSSRGFSTLFVERLNATRRQSHVTEVNLACPGETTETFVHGGCFYTALFGLPIHASYPGPQLEAAEAFLRGHRGQVNPIIHSLAANELFRPWTLDCDGDEACVAARIPDAVEAVKDNYELILSRLRALEPHATLLILVEYQFPTFPKSFNDGLALLYDQVRARVGHTGPSCARRRAVGGGRVRAVTCPRQCSGAAVTGGWQRRTGLAKAAGTR